MMSRTRKHPDRHASNHRHSNAAPSAFIPHPPATATNDSNSNSYPSVYSLWQQGKKRANDKFSLLDTQEVDVDSGLFSPLSSPALFPRLSWGELQSRSLDSQSTPRSLTRGHAIAEPQAGKLTTQQLRVSVGSGRISAHLYFDYQDPPRSALAASREPTSLLLSQASSSKHTTNDNRLLSSDKRAAGMRDHKSAFNSSASLPPPSRHQPHHQPLNLPPRLEALEALLRPQSREFTPSQSARSHYNPTVSPSSVLLVSNSRKGSNSGSQSARAPFPLQVIDQSHASALSSSYAAANPIQSPRSFSGTSNSLQPLSHREFDPPSRRSPSNEEEKMQQILDTRFASTTHQAIAQFLTSPTGSQLISEGMDSLADEFPSSDDLERIVRACSVRNQVQAILAQPSISSVPPNSQPLSRTVSLNRRNSIRNRNPKENTTLLPPPPSAQSVSPNALQTNPMLLDQTTPFESFHAIMSYFLAQVPVTPFPSMFALIDALNDSMRNRLLLLQFLQSKDHNLFPSMAKVDDSALTSDARDVKRSRKSAWSVSPRGQSGSTTPASSVSHSNSMISNILAATPLQTAAFTLRDVHRLIANSATIAAEAAEPTDDASRALAHSIAPIAEEAILPLLQEWNRDGYHYDSLNELSDVLQAYHHDVMRPSQHAQPQPAELTSAELRALEEEKTRQAEIEKQQQAEADSRAERERFLAVRRKESEEKEASHRSPRTISAPPPIALTAQEPAAAAPAAGNLGNNSPHHSKPFTSLAESAAASRRKVPTDDDEVAVQDEKENLEDPVEVTQEEKMFDDDPVETPTLPTDSPVTEAASYPAPTLMLVDPAAVSTEQSNDAPSPSATSFSALPSRSAPMPGEGPHPILQFFASPECTFFHPSFVSLLTTPQGEQELALLVDTLSLSAQVDQVLDFLVHINDRNRENHALNRATFGSRNSQSSSKSGDAAMMGLSSQLPVLRFESFEEFAMALGSGSIERILAAGGEKLIHDNYSQPSPLPAFPGSALALGRSDSLAQASPSLRSSFGHRRGASLSSGGSSRFSARTPIAAVMSDLQLPAQASHPGLHKASSLTMGTTSRPLLSPTSLTRGRSIVGSQHRGSIAGHKHQRSQSQHVVPNVTAAPFAQPASSSSSVSTGKTIPRTHSQSLVGVAHTERTTIGEYLLSPMSGSRLMSASFFQQYPTIESLLLNAQEDVDRLIGACGGSAAQAVIVLDQVAKNQSDRSHSSAERDAAVAAADASSHKIGSLNDLISVAAVTFRSELANANRTASRRSFSSSLRAHQLLMQQQHQQQQQHQSAADPVAPIAVPPSPISVGAGRSAPVTPLIQFRAITGTMSQELEQARVLDETPSSTRTTPLLSGLPHPPVPPPSAAAPSLFFTGAHDRTQKMHIYAYLSSVNLSPKLLFNELLDSEVMLSQILDEPILSDTLSHIKAIVDANKEANSRSNTSTPNQTNSPRKDTSPRRDRQAARTFSDYSSLLFYIDNRHRSIENLSTQLVLYLSRNDSTLFRHRMHPLDVTVEDVEEYLLLEAGVVDVTQYVLSTNNQHYPKIRVFVRELMKMLHGMEASDMEFDNLIGLAQSLRISWQVKKSIYALGGAHRRSSFSSNRSTDSTISSTRSSVGSTPSTYVSVHPFLNRQASDEHRESLRHRRAESRDRRHTRDHATFAAAAAESAQQAAAESAEQSAAESDAASRSRASARNIRIPPRSSIAEESHTLSPHSELDHENSVSTPHDVVLDTANNPLISPATEPSAAPSSSIPSIHLTADEELAEANARKHLMELLSKLPRLNFESTSESSCKEVDALLPLCEVSHTPHMHLERHVEDIVLQQRQLQQQADHELAHLAATQPYCLLNSFDDVHAAVEQADIVLQDRKASIYSFLADRHSCPLWSGSLGPILPSQVERLFALRRTPHVESYNLIVQFLQSQVLLKHKFSRMNELCEAFGTLQRSTVQHQKSAWAPLLSSFVNSPASPILPIEELLSDEQADFMMSSTGCTVSTMLYLIESWSGFQPSATTNRSFVNWVELEAAFARHTDASIFYDDDGNVVGRRVSDSEQARHEVQSLLSANIEQFATSESTPTVDLPLISALVDSIASQLTYYRSDPSVDMLIHMRKIFASHSSSDFFEQFLKSFVTASAPSIAQFDALQSVILTSMSQAIDSTNAMDEVLRFTCTTLFDVNQQSVAESIRSLSFSEIIQKRKDANTARTLTPGNEKNVRRSQRVVSNPASLMVSLPRALSPPITNADLEELRSRLLDHAKSRLLDQSIHTIDDDTLDQLIENGGHSSSFVHAALDLLEHFGAVEVAVAPASPTSSASRSRSVSSLSSEASGTVIQPPFTAMEQLIYAVRRAKFQCFTDKQELFTWLQTHESLAAGDSESVGMKSHVDVMYETTRAGFFAVRHLNELFEQDMRFTSFDALVAAVTNAHSALVQQLDTDRTRLRALLRGEADPDAPHQAPQHSSALLYVAYPEQMGSHELQAVQTCLNSCILSTHPTQLQRAHSLYFASQILFRMRTLVPYLIKRLREKEESYKHVHEVVSAIQNLYKEYIMELDKIQLKLASAAASLVVPASPSSNNTSGTRLDVPFDEACLHELFLLELSHGSNLAAASSVVLPKSLMLDSYLMSLKSQHRTFKTNATIFPALRALYAGVTEQSRAEQARLRQYLESDPCHLLDDATKRLMNEQPALFDDDLQKLVVVGQEFHITALYLVKLLVKTRASAGETTPLVSSIGELLAPVQKLSTTLQARNIQLLRFIQSPAHIHTLLSTHVTKHLNDRDMFHLREIEDEHELDVVETLTAIDEQRRNEAGDKPVEGSMFESLPQLEHYLDNLIAQEYGGTNPTEGGEELESFEERLEQATAETPNMTANNSLPAEVSMEADAEVAEVASNRVIDVEAEDEKADLFRESRVTTPLPALSSLPVSSPYDEPDCGIDSPTKHLIAGLEPRTTTPAKGSSEPKSLSHMVSASDLLQPTEVSFQRILASPTPRSAQEVRAKVESALRRQESKRKEQQSALTASPSMSVLLSSKAEAPSNPRSISPMSSIRFAALPQKLYRTGFSDEDVESQWRDKRGVEEIEYRFSQARIMSDHSRREKQLRNLRNHLLQQRQNDLSDVTRIVLAQPMKTRLKMSLDAPLFTLNPSQLWLSSDQQLRHFNIHSLPESDTWLCVKVSVPDELKQAFLLYPPLSANKSIEVAKVNARMSGGHNKSASSTSSILPIHSEPAATAVYEFLKPGLNLRIGVEYQATTVNASAFHALFPAGSNELQFELQIEVCMLQEHEIARCLLPAAKAIGKSATVAAAVAPNPHLPSAGPIRSAEHFWKNEAHIVARLTYTSSLAVSFDRVAVDPQLMSEFRRNKRVKVTPQSTETTMSRHVSEPAVPSVTSAPSSTAKVESVKPPAPAPKPRPPATAAPTTTTPRATASSTPRSGIRKPASSSAPKRPPVSTPAKKEKSKVVEKTKVAAKKAETAVTVDAEPAAAAAAESISNLNEQTLSQPTALPIESEAAAENLSAYLDDSNHAAFDPFQPPELGLSAGPVTSSIAEPQERLTDEM